jgi:peptidoglycan/xylan/chitin deacetylase (PgdA/CDA1 family)
VLAYHRVATPESDRWRLAVSPERFAEHIEVINDGFRPCSLAQLTAALEHGTKLRKAVVVTFDDGYRDNLLEAKPLLERHGVPATVFVVTGYTDTNGPFWWDGLELLARHAGWTREELEATWRGLRVLPHAARREQVDGMLRESGLEPDGEPTALTADEIRTLADGGLVEVGSHTVTHPSLTALTPGEQLQEITGSREFLERLLERPVESFSYPHGEFDRTTVECVRKAGFRRACAGGQRAVSRGTPALRIPRVHALDVAGDELAAMLESRLRT